MTPTEARREVNARKRATKRAENAERVANGVEPVKGTYAGIDVNWATVRRVVKGQGAYVVAGET